MLLLIFFICLHLQSCLGLTIFGDKGGAKQEGVESSRRRQMMILTTLSSVVIAPIIIIPAKSYDLDADGSIKYEESLETINWNAPKSRGLNTERMADAINDSIKETNWLVTGMGRPEYFSDNFHFRSDEYTTPLMNVRGYKNYCRRVRTRHLTEEYASSFDLICCSVTRSNEITALWRYHYKYNRGGRILSRYRYWVDTEQTKSQVIQTVFKTSNDDDGLVVSATEKVIIRDNAPDADVLRGRCNWYTCGIDGYTTSTI